MSKYVYICSAGHSGSTLLDLLLGSHSRIESLGEVAHLPKNIKLNTVCSCGKKVRECGVWLKELNELDHRLGIDILSSPYEFNTGYPVAVTVVDYEHQTRLYMIKRKLSHAFVYLSHWLRLKNKLLYTKYLDEAIDHRFLLYDIVRKHRHADIVVDSSKTYIEALSLYNADPENVRIILLSRDGRGVMYSNMKRNLGRRNGLVGWKHYYSRAVPLIKKNVNSNNYLFVKYEELALNTDNQLKILCDYLGVSYEPSMRYFTEYEHHITNGNDMRFSTDSKIRLDTSWRDSLAEKDYAYFEKNAGPLNRELGYQD